MVLVLGDILRVDRRIERRPATAGVELRVGLEQRRAAAHAAVRSGGFVVPIFAAERALGALLAGHAILFGRELRFPFGVGFAMGVAHGSIVSRRGGRCMP